MNDALTESNRAWRKAFCERCRSVQPVSLEHMPIDPRNKTDALDVVCRRCAFVVATLFESEPVNRQKNKQLRALIMKLQGLLMSSADERRATARRPARRARKKQTKR